MIIWLWEETVASETGLGNLDSGTFQFNEDIISVIRGSLGTNLWVLDSWASPLEISFSMKIFTSRKEARLDRGRGWTLMCSLGSLAELPGASEMGMAFKACLNGETWLSSVPSHQYAR